MKQLLILSLILVFSNLACSQNQTSSMKLTLSITHQERSKDSHSTNQVWKIEGNELSFSENYQGRRGNKKPIQKKSSISDVELESISNLLENKGLYIQMPSPKYNEFNAPYSAIHVNLKTHKDKEDFVIDIYKLAKNIPEDAVYQKINELKNLLDSYLE
jgi:uncharacterized protein YcgL (UPF0745 family)